MVFLGILLAIFVGVGIAAFYKAPTFPEYPAKLQSRVLTQEGLQSATLSAVLDKEEQEYNKKQKSFTEQNEKYSRNVSIIALILSILFLIISLTLAKDILIIADGLLLGGVLTLIYSMIRGFGSNDEMFRFIVVAIGLFISLIIGYLKFIKPLSR